MGPKLGRAAGVTGTTIRIEGWHEHDVYLKRVADTHVDSANPLRFFLGTECSPFSANGWLFAGALLVGAKGAECGAKEDQNDRKEPQEEHGFGGGCSHSGEDSRLSYAPLCNEVIHQKLSHSQKIRSIRASRYRLDVR